MSKKEHLILAIIIILFGTLAMSVGLAFATNVIIFLGNKSKRLANLADNDILQKKLIRALLKSMPAPVSL